MHKIQRGGYTDRQQIVDAINRKMATINKLRSDAMRMRKSADAKMSKAERLEFRSLAYLKARLDQFDTMRLPGVTITTTIPK